MLSALAISFLLADVKTSPSYVAEIEKWRQAREARLKAEDGWLSLTGLSWLKDGTNVVGSDPGSDVVLPAGKAPAKLGVLELRNGKAHWKPEAGATVLINGKAAGESDVKSDAASEPDLLSIGDVKFYVIHRGTKEGVRVKDKNSEYRRNFTGLHWYPVKENWRIVAKWVAYDKPKKLLFDTVVGEKEEDESLGYAVFQKDGKEYRIEPTVEGDHLFYVFRDATAGKTTYPAARFLTSEMPKDRTVVLDFNKAYNPPCVFTPYATCPLPPQGNRFPFALEAGELMYHSGAHH